MNALKWWKNVIAYQVYPRSFKDSNGDGIGDLPGLTEKLDYLKDLGVDVIWICPMYKSPNDDNGYDISDYCDIMDEFGTMADFDTLLEAVHVRGMKLIIDLVVNHTSDEHAWFVESRSSKDNPKRDWYIWREGKADNTSEPNNWESIFTGSAWEKDTHTDEYFLHIFSKRQPDLNWENKEVREAIYRMINWWLDKGIDGFRVDAISHLKKEDGFPDMPNPDGKTYVNCFDKMMNVPGVEHFIAELKERTFAHYDIMTVGEANGVGANHCDFWVGEENGAFNMIFQFSHIALRGDNRLKVKDYKYAMNEWQAALHGKGWNALFLENHDQSRILSRWGNPEKYWAESAKTLALSYFMNQGTPFIYQGQEIGMTNTLFDTVDDFDDAGCKASYYELTKQGMQPYLALQQIANFSRDNTRTPMQWDSSVQAGFTQAPSAWFKVNPNYKTINVASQLNNPNSIYHFYKKMIHIRKNDLTFTTAPCYLLMPDHDTLYAYVRPGDTNTYIIICNMSNEESVYTEATYTLEYNQLLLFTHHVEPHTPTHTLTLSPWESRLYCVKTT